MSNSGKFYLMDLYHLNLKNLIIRIDVILEKLVEKKYNRLRINLLKNMIISTKYLI